MFPDQALELFDNTRAYTESYVINHASFIQSICFIQQSYYSQTSECYLGSAKNAAVSGKVSREGSMKYRKGSGKSLVRW